MAGGVAASGAGVTGAGAPVSGAGVIVLFCVTDGTTGVVLGVLKNSR